MLLGGASAEEIQILLGRLTAEDRQAILCTACYLVDEIDANCPERAEQIVAIIAANCVRQCSGRKVCRQTPASVCS